MKVATAEDVQKAYELPHPPMALPLVLQPGFFVAVRELDLSHPLEAVLKNSKGAYIKEASPELLWAACLATAETNKKREADARHFLLKLAESLGTGEESIRVVAAGWHLTLYGKPLPGMHLRWDVHQEAWRVQLQGTNTCGWGDTPRAAWREAMESHTRTLRARLQEFEAFLQPLELI